MLAGLWGDSVPCFIDNECPSLLVAEPERSERDATPREDFHEFSQDDD